MWFPRYSLSIAVNCGISTRLNRSTSMRTMSVVNSRAGTPKVGTLSSHDLHYGHHTSFSSGSRTLDRSQVSSFDHPVASYVDNQASLSPPLQNRTFHTFQGKAGHMGPLEGGVSGNHAGYRSNTLGNNARGKFACHRICERY